MNTIKKLLLSFILLSSTLLFSTTTNTDNKLAIFYTIDGNVQEQYTELVEKKLSAIGYKLTDSHKRINDQFETKYGSTVLDVLSFMPVANNAVILPLLNIDPRLAGFAPFNMLIYKKLDENVTHVGHLMPKVMLDILGIENEEVRKKFSTTFKSLDATMAQTMGGKQSFITYKKLPEQKMINFEYEFEKTKNIEDFIDKFQDKFELAFIDKGYLVAGYHNLMESTKNARETLSSYDAFWTYSLAHLEFSYTMFDNEGARPDAALFAPSSMYIYIKKGSNKLVLGMFRLQNWSETLEISDPKRLSFIEKLDKEIPEILTTFGMTAVANSNPLTAPATGSKKATKVIPVEKEKPAEVKVIEKIPVIPVPEDALAVMYTLEGDVEKPYNSIIEKELKSIDFIVTDPHHRVNDQYKKRYGSTVLDTLSFLSVANNKVILPLLNIDPRIAATAPFNMLIYKRLDENVTHVGHLMPKAFLDMIGITDKKVRETFTASMEPLNAKLEAEFKSKGLKYTKSYTSYKKLPENRTINFEYSFEAPEDMEDFTDEFQEKFEQAFIDKKYLIAGYHNLMESRDDAEEILKDYDAFWTYSLCHLEFSYNMFDNKDAHPEAGLFAPCTMYMYIKKGSNKIVIGMLRLQNWSDTLGIEDSKRVELVKKLDKEMPEIMTAFGMKAIENVNTLLVTEAKENKTEIAKTKMEKTKAKIAKKEVLIKEKVTKINVKRTKPQSIDTARGSIKIALPTVPKPIEAIKLGGSHANDRGIKFSKRVPPNYIPHSFDNKKKVKVSANTRIGEVNQGRISAYLRGKFMEVKAVEEKLKAAGFEVLSAEPVNKKGDLISVVFTNKAIVTMASKAQRGFMGALRVLVDKKEKTISITNPLYMAKGFMQDDFDEKSAKKVLDNILIQFPNLKNAKDALKFQLLSKYQFMNGMPKYESMIEVASGSDLVERLKDNKKVVFTQKLDNGSTLIGIKLSKRTRKFTKRIGRNNAAMLPYPILIEDGKAMILDPKYYISFMYPLLQMSQFMTIATVPDAMIKDCEKVFKKKRKK